MDKRKKILGICIVLIAVFSFAAIFLAVRTVSGLFRQPTEIPVPSIEAVQQESMPDETAPRETVYRSEESIQNWGTRVTVDGKNWKRKRGVQSLLFMGIEDSTDVVVDGIRGEMGTARSIFLLVLDDVNKEIRCLVLPHFTDVPVTLYDENGSAVGTASTMLGYQFAFSRSVSRSSMLMKKAAADLMNGIAADGFVSVTYEGIGQIADALGGIPVLLTMDWTDVDPSYVSGRELMMNSEVVSRFIQSEKFRNEDFDNPRQEWLLMTMLKQMKRVYSQTFLDQLNPSIPIKIEVDADMIRKMKEYSFDEEILRMPGTYSESSGLFRVDRTAFDQLLLELFYTAE